MTNHETARDAAVPPPATRADDQAALFREAANALAAVGLEDSLVSGPRAWAEAIETLRRMADEAQQPRIPRCPSCGHHSCDGDGPCGALLGVTVTSKKRCACPGPGAEGPGGPCVAGEQQNETPEGKPGCAHCGGDHAWDDCEAYTALVAQDGPPAPLRRSEDDCPGFPERCPNLRPVDPNPPKHYGGIRCGCADAEPSP